MSQTPYKDFVIVIPSYNNAKWYQKNLESVLSQDYPGNHWRIVYTDDASPDGTGELVQNYIATQSPQLNIKLVRNTERLGALHNLYNMIHDSRANEIIVTVDADDYLASPGVLKRLNQEYQNENVWMTWGSYLDYPGMSRGCSKPFPQKVIALGSYSSHPWCMSHLRTFYAGLFQKIKREDLMYQGRFAEMGWDVMFMLKMAQMSAGRFSYIHDILYFYNNENAISDHRVNQQLQGAIDRYARMQKPYNKLERLFE